MGSTLKVNAESSVGYVPAAAGLSHLGPGTTVGWAAGGELEVEVSVVVFLAEGLKKHPE